MYQIYLLKDTRTGFAYKEYVGRTFRKPKILTINLYDPDLREMRKQRVNIKLIKQEGKTLTMEVV